MLFSEISVFILFFLNFDSNMCIADEPMCSKFSCEEQLLEKMIRQEVKVEMMLNDIKKTQESVANTLDEIQKTGLKIVEDMKKPSIAYFAHNVVDLKLDKTDKIIIYTATTTNEGSGYDTSTGIFTAPVGGLYQFIVNYCSINQQHSSIALVKKSENIIARSSNYDKDYYTCTSFHAVIRVEPGERIWVKCISGLSSRKLYKDSSMMNSFSGFLINR